MPTTARLIEDRADAQAKVYAAGPGTAEHRIKLMRGTIATARLYPQLRRTPDGHVVPCPSERMRSETFAGKLKRNGGGPKDGRPRPCYRPARPV